MACMCGDLQCWSCGPAQGNVRCPLCRAWVDEGCHLHLTPEGEIKPQYRDALRKAEAEERQGEEQMAEEYRAAQEWRRKGLI